jgi:hypothetical protein
MTGHATEHRALPSQLTAHLDSELGLDASDVRLHTDAEAAHRVAGAGAVAGTVDNDVSFAAGAFRPPHRTALDRA